DSRRRDEHNDRHCYSELVPSRSATADRNRVGIHIDGNPAGRHIQLRESARHRGCLGGDGRMTTTVLPTGMPDTQGVTHPGRLKKKTRLGDKLLYAYTLLVIIWLSFPVAIMILFSFNATKGRYNGSWQGFTFKWYGRLGQYPDLKSALLTSLSLALLT